jgi:hypothetical protein
VVVARVFEFVCVCMYVVVVVVGGGGGGRVPKGACARSHDNVCTAMAFAKTACMLWRVHRQADKFIQRPHHPCVHSCIDSFIPWYAPLLQRATSKTSDSGRRADTPPPSTSSTRTLSSLQACSRANNQQQKGAARGMIRGPTRLLTS